MLGFIWKVLIGSSVLLLRFFHSIWQWLGSSWAWITGSAAIGTASVSASVAGFASSFLVIAFMMQGITWLLSIIITLFLAFYGTEALSFVFSLTPLQDYVNGMVTEVKSFGSTLDGLSFLIPGNSVDSNTAFGNISFDSIFRYFSFYKFLDFVIAITFGVFILKFNIYVFKFFSPTRRFNNGGAGAPRLPG